MTPLAVGWLAILALLFGAMAALVVDLVAEWRDQHRQEHPECPVCGEPFDTHTRQALDVARPLAPEDREDFRDYRP